MESVSNSSRANYGIGMLFQRPVLFPFKDVLGQYLVCLQTKKDWNMDEVNAIMNEMGLKGKEHQTIETLSGGEAQRRLDSSTSTNPNLMLLDEPLSALDVNLRRKIALEIRSILKARGIPAIHVTHDPAEAELLAIELFIGTNYNQVMTMKSSLFSPRPWIMWKYAWRKRSNRLIFSSFFGVFFLVSIGIPYGITNRISEFFDWTLFDPSLTIDDSITYIPLLNLAYFSFYAYYVLIPFFALTEGQRKATIIFSQRMFVATIPVFLIFLFAPVEVSIRTEVAGNDVLTSMLSLIHFVDQPYNAWPSLHVGHSLAWFFVFLRSTMIIVMRTYLFGVLGFC